MIEIFFPREAFPKDSKLFNRPRGNTPKVKKLLDSLHGPHMIICVGAY